MYVYCVVKFGRNLQNNKVSADTETESAWNQSGLCLVFRKHNT